MAHAYVQVCSDILQDTSYLAMDMCIRRLNFTNVGSEVYSVCAGLELYNVGMNMGVVVCRQRCSEELW